MKKCTCGVTGPENFYKSKSTKDGLNFYCKTCIARQRREEYRRKFPNGKNGGIEARSKALIGNKRAWKHGKYAGFRNRARKEVKPTPKLDLLINKAWT
jgi:hypothetical protein